MFKVSRVNMQTCTNLYISNSPLSIHYPGLALSIMIVIYIKSLGLYGLIVIHICKCYIMPQSNMKARPLQEFHMGPMWAPFGQLCGPHLGDPLRTQNKVSGGPKWAPSGLPMWVTHFQPNTFRLEGRHRDYPILIM